MKPGDPIAIEVVANGWLVRPQLYNETCQYLNWNEVQVFQYLDYAPDGCQNEKCLAGFIVRHFAAGQPREEK